MNRKTCGRGSKALICFIVVIGFLTAAHGEMADTRHNLSASGPGTVKAAGSTEICAFCHAPHPVTTVPGLWSRQQALVTYNLYSSSTLEATLKQPTGSSRMCLSCHDGLTAPAVSGVGAAGRMSPGRATGRAVIGTDLSDDHPISFVYDAALALSQGELADPKVLRRKLPLDNTQQLQCASCHDPHDDRYRYFLRMDDRDGALCSACHIPKNWPSSAHATSPATWRGAGPNPWPESPYTTVAENSCQSCHRSHAAPHPARLLSAEQERAVCLVCHNGNVATTNLEPEFLKFSAHPVTGADWIHDPRENPTTMRRHSTCTDCHNPHQSRTKSAGQATSPASVRGVSGVNLAGLAVREAAYEYEICLRCHGIRNQTGLGVVRLDGNRNVRLSIDPSNPSYHPVAAVGRNRAITGFEPGYSTASIISCLDCHNNDEWSPTDTKPRGPHGSRFAPILEREYDSNDPTVESFQTYGLCYKCHNRHFLMSDLSRSFSHKVHVGDQQAPCAVCHDAHGSRHNPGLINFMLRDRNGKVVVTPSQQQGRLEYIALGTGRSQCYLQCHGRNHEPGTYP